VAKNVSIALQTPAMAVLIARAGSNLTYRASESAISGIGLPFPKTAYRAFKRQIQQKETNQHEHANSNADTRAG